MMVPSTEPQSSATRRVPQVVLLLDAEAHVLSVNRSLAGTAFASLKTDENAGLHEQLHGDCGTECRFNELWKKAWHSLSSTDGVEWEVDDPVIDRLLRINLAKPPAADGVVVDRRRGHALLIMTDITKHRREYESLIRRERALMRIVREQDEDYEDPANDDDAQSQDTSFGSQLILALESERRRIASELHDGIAQSAGVIKYNIEAAIETLSRSDASLDLGLLESVVDQTRSLLEEVRRISTNLGPSMLDDFGLCVALKCLCEEFRSDTCDYRPACSAQFDETDLPYVVKIAAYRVVQEALNNIAKHASAKVVQVRVETTDGGLLLEVSDDGVGFEVDPPAGEESDFGSGLQNMRERVETTGGTFSLDAESGTGTAIRATWNRAALDLLRDETVLDGVHGNR